MKSRSSTGVGQKIDLEYDINTMRITDAGGEDEGTGFRKPNSSIMESIKAKSQVHSAQHSDSTTEDTPRVTSEVQSNKLKQLLGQIKQT
jgi:hypothetical protein